MSIQLNGQPVACDAEPQVLLVDFLRGRGLTGTHVGCDTAQCGACTVLLDGEAVKSCVLLAVQADGHDVMTIEGLAADDGTLHPIQQAFIDCHGLQCGFCTPGFVMATACLLARRPAPGEDEIVHGLEGNLCRCTGYVNIVRSVQRAALLLGGEAAPAGAAPEARHD